MVMAIYDQVTYAVCFLRKAPEVKLRERKYILRMTLARI